jgi:hypothetical protein
MRVAEKGVFTGWRTAALMIAMGAALTAMPASVRAEPDIANLAALDTVYVADPAAPWFQKWTETNLRPRDWLYRPDIRIKAGADLVAAVAADPSGIGLLTRGELSRLQAAGAPSVGAVPAGLSICAALSVNVGRMEENFGDFALSGDMIDVLATPDTQAVAEALIDAHRLKDRVTLKPVKSAADLATGSPGLTVLPVLRGTRLHLPENAAASLRPIAMTQAESAAMSLRGLSSGDYRTSFFQQFPFVNGVRTACDDIVLIAAPGGAVAPEVFKTAPSPWVNPYAGSDLETRVLQALDALKSLWGKSTEAKG